MPNFDVEYPPFSLEGKSTSTAATKEAGATDKGHAATQKQDDETDNMPLIWSRLKAPIVKQIACAKNRTLLLLQTGELYTWHMDDGNSSYIHHLDKFGSFGTVQYTDRQDFTSKDKFTPHPVIRIAAGKQHYVALTNEGMWNMYTWGSNARGQLGHGEVYTNKKLLKTLKFDNPTRVWSTRLNDRVADVVCGTTFTVCTLANRQVYGFGSGAALAGPASKQVFGGGTKGSSFFGKKMTEPEFLSPHPIPLVLFHPNADDITAATERGQLVVTEDPVEILFRKLDHNDLQSRVHTAQLNDLISATIRNNADLPYEVSPIPQSKVRMADKNLKAVPKLPERPEEEAYDITARVTSSASPGEEQSVTAHLETGEKVRGVKMKLQALLNEAMLRQYSKAKRNAEDKNVGEKELEEAVAQPILLLDPDQLWLSCGEQEMDNEAATLNASRDSLYISSTAYATPKDVKLVLTTRGSVQRTTNKKVTISLQTSEEDVKQAITVGPESVRHPPAPPIRMHVPAVKLAASGNYLIAWTSPFDLSDDVDAVTHNERIHEELEKTNIRLWDYRVRQQQTALDAAEAASKAGASEGSGATFKPYNVRNLYMGLQVNTDIFLRQAKKAFKNAQHETELARDAVQQQKGEILDNQEQLAAMKRALAGEIEKTSKADVSNPFGALLGAMNEFPHVPESYEKAKTKGPAYTRNLWGVYRNSKGSTLKKGDKVVVLSTHGRSRFDRDGSRSHWSPREVTNPEPHSGLDEILKFLESIGFPRSKKEVAEALVKVCGGLESVLCYISRYFHKFNPDPGPSGGIEVLDIYSSHGDMTYNEFVDWGNVGPHRGPRYSDCCFCPDKYYHKVGGRVYKGTIPYVYMHGTIVKVNDISNTKVPEVNEAEDIPHPFKRAKLWYTYKVRLDGPAGLTIDNLPPRMLEVKRGRPEDTNYNMFREKQANFGKELEDLNAFHSAITNLTKQVAVSEDKLMERRLTVAKAETRLMVLNRMKLRLSKLYNQQLQVEIVEMHQKHTRHLYTNFYFKVRFMCNYDLYMARTQDLARLGTRQSKLTRKQEAEQMRAQYYEQLSKSSAAAVPREEETTELPCNLYNYCDCDVTEENCVVLRTINDNIVKCIKGASQYIFTDAIERHVFNIEGAKIIAGLAIVDHWEFMVARTCKRERLRRILSQPDGAQLRWNFLEDLEQIFDMKVTAQIPTTMCVNSMRKEFMDAFGSSIKKMYFNRTYLHQSFYQEVIGRGGRPYELNPLELVLSRGVVNQIDQRICIVEMQAMVDCVGDCNAVMRAVLYREKDFVSASAGAESAMSEAAKQKQSKEIRNRPMELELIAHSREVLVAPSDGCKWVKFKMSSAVHIKLEPGKTRAVFWIGLQAGTVFGARPRAYMFGHSDSALTVKYAADQERGFERTNTSTALPPRKIRLESSSKANAFDKNLMLDGDLAVVAFHAGFHVQLVNMFTFNAKLRMEMNIIAHNRAQQKIRRERRLLKEATDEAEDAAANILFHKKD